MHGGRPALLLAATAATGLIMVLGPFDRPDREPEAPAGIPALIPPALAVPGLGSAAPRGSLADDAAFVDALRLLPWSPDEQAGAHPELGLRSVVFAGDVPGGRWALVVGQVLGPPDAPGSPADGPGGRSGLMAVWFGGPPGARPEQLAPLTPPTRAPADAPLGLLDQRTGTLVVVTAPGDVVEVSERPEVAEDGNVYRAFREVRTVDGVAVAQLRPSDVPVSTAAVYEVRRGDRTVAHTVPATIGGRSGEGLPVTLEEPRGPTPGSARPVVTRTAERLLAPLGLSRYELRVSVLWAGDLPGPGPESGSAAVVAATLPSGAVVVDGEWLLPVESPSGDYVQGGDCGLAVLPAGRPVADRVHALGCAVVDPSGGGATVRSVLLVLTPPEVARVRLYDENSDFLAEHPVVDGVVVVPAPRGVATVEAVTTGDVSLGRTDLLGRGVRFD